MKSRLLLLFVALAAVSALAGCGGGSSDGSTAAPATIVPADSPVFISATVRPEGSLKSNIDSLAQGVAGIPDVGAKIISELEESAEEDGEPFDYAKEVEPWLGEEGGIYLTGYDGDEFTGQGFVFQTSDAGATEDFIEEQAKSNDEPVTDGSYEGVDYKTESDDETTFGVVGDFVVIGGDVDSFKAAVDASNGDGLADVDRYTQAVSGVPDGSLADVYVDIGGLIEQSEDAVDPEAKMFLQAAGIDPDEATATASVIPGSDSVEIDFSTDVVGDNAPTGNASDLLGSLPAESLAAFVSPEFGKAFGNAVDGIDASGVPGEIPPHKFKEGLKSAGIDLERIAGSIGDLGVFVQGSSMSSLDGAVVLTTEDATEATNTVSNIGLLLRSSGTSGITAIGGKASGFSIRSADLGPKPLVVAAEGKRIAIGYGLPAALLGLSEKGPALSGDAEYKAAVSALGGTPISGFVDGPGALRLVESLVPSDETDFQEAKPYLKKVGFVAIGSGVADGLLTAKLIVGFDE